MIDTNNPYFKRVQLLVRILPHITNIDCFALKGGTAINTNALIRLGFFAKPAQNDTPVCPSERSEESPM